MNRLFSLLFIACCSCVWSQDDVIRVTLPDKDPIKLVPYGKIGFAEINECSGIVKSRTFTNVFWMHNDSGDKARIFAVRKDGTIIKPEATNQNYQGIIITDAKNQDWEDIAIDDQGNLIVADSGNNWNLRKNLCIYVVKEPNPYKQSTTVVSQRVPFYYTDQDSFPPTKRNFDAEAIFWAFGKLHLLTKHWSDRFTKMYRFDSLDSQKSNPLTPISRFDIHGMVTAADVSEDGKKMVVLTYNNVWLFELKESSSDYFRGKISWLPIIANQCEGICFFENMIYISNEQKDLFELSTDQLIVVRE